MKVIGHQTKGMHLPGRFSANISERLQERFAILVVAKDVLATIAAAHDMVNRSRKLNA